MSEKSLFTVNHGIVTVKDVIVDTDGTNLADGVDIRDENGILLIEVAGYCCDDIENEEDVENLICDNED